MTRWGHVWEWAFEVAENIGGEGRDRQVPGTEQLIRDALDRYLPTAARALPPWLLAIVWPFVERAAFRGVKAKYTSLFTLEDETVS